MCKVGKAISPKVGKVDFAGRAPILASDVCYRVGCKVEALEAILGSIVIEYSEILIELRWLEASYLCSGLQRMFLRPE
jgi:hypothetical protein